MAVIKRIKKGDKCRINFVLKKPSGTPWDLTGATVTARFVGGMEPTTISKTCTIDVAVSGTCHSDLASTETVNSGNYKIEVKMDWGAGVEHTTIDYGELEIQSTLA